MVNQVLSMVIYFFQILNLNKVDNCEKTKELEQENQHDEHQREHNDLQIEENIQVLKVVILSNDFFCGIFLSNKRSRKRGLYLKVW